MNERVHYIGLDVHKETIGGGRERTDILAALARRGRKVKDAFWFAYPGCRSQTRYTLGYYLSSLQDISWRVRED